MAIDFAGADTPEEPGATDSEGPATETCGGAAETGELSRSEQL